MVLGSRSIIHKQSGINYKLSNTFAELNLKSKILNRK